MQKYQRYIFSFIFLLVGCTSTEGNVNYGLNHYDMGLYHYAIPSLLKSVPELEKTAPLDQRVTRGYLALGIMAENDKQYEKAEHFLIKALETAQIVNLNRNTHIRNAHSTLGNFYLNREKYDFALKHLSQAFDISNEENLKPTLIAIDLDNLALVHAELGEYVKSLALSKQALELNEQSPTHKYYLRTKGIVYFNRAKTYELINENKLAKDNYDLSIEALILLVKTAPYEQWRLDLVKKEKTKFTTNAKKL